MKRQARHQWCVSLRQSVRTRLTLWYLAVMALIIVVYGGSLYASETFLNTNLVESRLETQLNQDSSQFAPAYQQALSVGKAPADLHLALSNQEMVLLLHPDGSILDARGPLTSSLIQQLQVKARQNAGLVDLMLPVSQNHEHSWWGNPNAYRVLITPVINGNARIATLLIGLPRQGTIPLFAIWFFWGTVALLVAALGGYWMAGKALRPVKMITHAANEISATDLRRRLPIQRRDEFGELAETFNHMLTRLEAAFKRQAQFTADASHELRTPLTIIDLETDRALTQCERPEEYRQVLEQIQAECAHMTAMVNSLLLLARADTGQVMLDMQEVDLSDLALASVERLLPLARRNEIILATGELPEVLVRGDPHYLGQVLLNIIENGIKYTSHIGKRVHVELISAQGWGIVRVQDDGPGIAEEHLTSLFERFYRVDKARGRPSSLPRQRQAEPGGTGLGLSIAQWIVQAHGGEIRVESKLGTGTLFEVRLPLLGSAKIKQKMTIR